MKTLQCLAWQGAGFRVALTLSAFLFAPCPQAFAASPVKSMPARTSPFGPSQGAAGAWQIRSLKSTTARLPAAPVASVPVEVCVAERLGGSIYSTGTDDVLVRIIWVEDYPRRVGVVSPLDRSPLKTLHGIRELPVCLVSPKERFIGLKGANGTTVNLGKLPPGEIIFGFKEGQWFYRTGEGSRNPDNLPHAVVRTYSTGRLEAWFEDGVGRVDDRDFLNGVLQVTGGVSDNNSVADLLNVIKEEQGEPRQAAIDALRKINPKALALGAVR